VALVRILADPLNPVVGVLIQPDGFVRRLAMFGLASLLAGLTTDAEGLIEE
jgi:hypothetical protein